MKNIIASFGMVAAGVAGLQSAYADGLDVVSPKAWNVSANLRGFYDSNYNINSARKGSYGAELSPTISFNIPLRQTDIGLRYIYGLYYYQDRDSLGLNAFDQTHQLDVWLDHSFNERWKLNLTDTFAVGQEPELLGPTSLSAPNGQLFRIDGNNIANHANATLSTDWTRLFSTALHYANHFYDYRNSGTTLDVNTPMTGWNQLSGPATYAGLLNRVEQSAGLDLQWHFQPETMGFVGYNFSLVNYTGNEPIGVFNYYDMTLTPRSVVYNSNARDNITHYGYVGVQHTFTPSLSGMVRGGVSYTDNYNDPRQKTTSLAPYADLSLTYSYLPGSYAQLGFTHDINATDVATVNASNGSLTLYQESSVVYASVNHHFTPKFLGTVIGRCQYSDYKGGPSSNGAETIYGIGVNLHYQFNLHFSAELGYNYDDLASTGNTGNGTYSRNRVYLGLGANY